MNSKISSLMRLILLLLSIVLTQPACAAAKTIFVRPPYAPGGVEVKYGKENGSSYKNAFPGPDALREAVSKKKIQLKPGDTIALVGGQFLYTWYDIRNSLNLEIDGFKGAEGKQIVITGKLAGYPNGVIYGLYLQSHQQSSRDAKSAWHDEKLWKSDAAGDNVKPGGETVAAKGWFYNEFYMSNPKLCKYGRLVDLDPDSNLWRYYHKAKTWREFVDSEGGSYFTVKEKFVSPFTGAQKNTSRIWIKPFRDIKNNKWAHRAVILGTSKALSSINFRNECKYVSVQDLAIYFAANPSGPVVDWKTPEFTTSHISFKRCRIWSNHFMAAMIFEPKNAQYLTIEVAILDGQ
ncbi:MAG: hypothetical protein SVS15_03925, partial [Thermodesulfobacteriota bacterium]|nr:hypothetical protein [Thermodesulfobacteriota bacterium]